MDRSIAARQILHKLEAIGQLAGDERAAVSALLGRMRRVDAGYDMVADGSSPEYSTLLVEGFGCRYKMLRIGERQIMSINVPGDVVDLSSFVLRKMDHAVLALTPCAVCEISHDSISNLLKEHPRLAKTLWRDTLVDGSLFRTWMVNNSRRPGEARAAHLFCEVYTKLKAVGLVSGPTFEFAVTQADLGDCLGLTPVHVNRVMKMLREHGLLIMSRSKVEILDWPKLADFAGFDSQYLHLIDRTA